MNDHVKYKRPIQLGFDESFIRLSFAYLQMCPVYVF